MSWLQRIFGAGSPSDSHLRIREKSLGILPRGTLLRTIVASPDGRRVAYVVRQGCRWHVVVDGRDVQKEYDLPIPFDLPMAFDQVDTETQEKVLNVLNTDVSKHTQLVNKNIGRV